MEEIYTFTKTELIAAFWLWNEAYEKNPEEFEEGKDKEEQQANTLLKYLKK